MLKIMFVSQVYIRLRVRETNTLTVIAIISMKYIRMMTDKMDKKSLNIIKNKIKQFKLSLLQKTLLTSKIHVHYWKMDVVNIF